MSKSLLGLHRAIEEQKPFNKAMRRLANWYVSNPITRAEIAEPLRILHDNFDVAHKILDVKHASELKPFHDRINQIKIEAKELGKKHLTEKEDLTLGYAQMELDLLKGDRTELPEEIKPLHKESWFVNLVDRLWPSRI